jgi:hypothetical protein
MPDRIMFYEDTYVVIGPNLEQQFVGIEQLRQLLGNLLEQAGIDLAPDLTGLDRETQIERLIATGCELTAMEGVWQWYAVRLEK